METAKQETEVQGGLSDAGQRAALDFKVAVEVMGWKPVYVRRDVEGRQMMFATRTYEGSIEDLDFYETKGPRMPCGWSPSTNIADAWQVVERMPMDLLKIDDGWLAICGNWRGEVRLPEDGHDGFIDMPIKNEDGWAVAKSAELAICRAALAELSAPEKSP